jgi:hypothetical protein
MRLVLLRPELGGGILGADDFTYGNMYLRDYETAHGYSVYGDDGVTVTPEASTYRRQAGYVRRLF